MLWIPCQHWTFPSDFQSYVSLALRQGWMRIFWWVEGSTGLGEGVTHWCFHESTKCSLCPFELSLYWKMSYSDGSCKAPCWRIYSKQLGRSTAPLFPLMVPWSSAVEASKEGLPIWGSWRNLRPKIGCWLCSSSLPLHLRILIKYPPV